MIAEQIEAVTAIEAFRKVGLGYVWDHPSHPIRLAADGLRERFEEVTAEILVTDLRSGSDGYLALHRTNLTTIQTRRSLSQDLEERCRQDTTLRNVPWRNVIEEFAMGVLKRYRQGEVIRAAADIAATIPRPDLIEKILLAGKPTLWYGPQGAGKGWLSMYAAVTVACGLHFAGLHTSKPTPVLYLDWEDSEETFHTRMDAVINGLDISMAAYPKVYYLKMRGPLARQIPRLLKDIEQLHIGLVIVDSVGLAMGAKGDGGSSYEDQAIGFFESLRYFEPAAVLLVDHVVGASIATGQLAGKAFGSIYKMAEARAAWEIRKEQDAESDEQLIGLHHTKHNHTKKYASMGIKIVFEEDDAAGLTVRFKSADIKQSVELSKQLPQKEQIEAYLMSEGAAAIDSIAEALELKRDLVRAHLNQMAKKGRAIKLPDGRWGIPEHSAPKPSYLTPLP